jgi:hypothetical protein
MEDGGDRYGTEALLPKPAGVPGCPTPRPQYAPVMAEIADTKAVPPPLLHHHTDHDGLIGIIDSEALWAAEVSYLNDLAEDGYARELVATAG